MTFQNEPAVEWALLYPTLIAGSLNRILPCENLEEAAREQVAWSERGIETRVVRRTISAWEDRG